VVHHARAELARSGAKAGLGVRIGAARTGVENAVASVAAAMIDVVVIVPGLRALPKSISTS
jgi:hypothetical protein